MNYIKRLEQENADLRTTLGAVRESIIEMQMYYTSGKFQGLNGAYAYTTTDILPKLASLKTLAQRNEIS